MHELLEKLIEKRGVELKDLDEEEQAQIERWQSVLSGKEVSLENVNKFCAIQIDMIEKQMDNNTNESQLNDRLVLLHSVYRKISKVLGDSTKVAREKLEAELTSMIYEPKI